MILKLPKNNNNKNLLQHLKHHLLVLWKKRKTQWELCTTLFSNPNQNQFVLLHQCHHTHYTPSVTQPCTNTCTTLSKYTLIAILYFGRCLPFTYTRTFIPSTVEDIYSDYVGPWRSKIVVIRKLARHLSPQQPIKQPAPPAPNGKKLHTEMIPTCTIVLLSLWGQISEA